MKNFFFGLFITFPALAEVVPLEKFDQAKLHQLLSRIPVALTKQEKLGSFVRHFYTYPKTGSFKINCEADFYSGYSLPSYYRCNIDMDTSLLQGDEILFKVTDSETVQNFYKAISYGSEVKKFYSEERMKGYRADGSFGQIFRYIFICSSPQCLVKLTLSKKLN
jgi:hypothetical protein